MPLPSRPGSVGRVELDSSASSHFLERDKRKHPMAIRSISATASGLTTVFLGGATASNNITVPGLLPRRAVPESFSCASRAAPGERCPSASETISVSAVEQTVRLSPCEGTRRAGSTKPGTGVWWKVFFWPHPSCDRLPRHPLTPTETDCRVRSVMRDML